MPTGWTSDTQPVTVLRSYNEGGSISDMALIIIAVSILIFIVIACCWFIQAGKRMVRYEEKGKSGEEANLIRSHENHVATVVEQPAYVTTGRTASAMEQNGIQEMESIVPVDVSVPPASEYVDYSNVDIVPPTQFSSDNVVINTAEVYDQQNVQPQEEVEFRVDPTDGEIYTFDEFQQEYGDDAAQRWEAQAATAEWHPKDFEESEVAQETQPEPPAVCSEDF